MPRDKTLKLISKSKIRLIHHLYILIVLLALLASLISFKNDYPLHLRIFSLLLGLTLATEIFSHYYIGFIHLKTNLPVYNVFMLIEFWVYGLYYRIIINFKTIKKIIGYFLFVFPIFWFFTVFIIFKSLDIWNSYLIIVGFLFSIFWPSIFCYQLFTSSLLINFRTSNEFWIAIAMIIFYTCNLPYLGMYHFITNSYPKLAEQLKIVLQLSDSLMYLIFIYAFLCRMTITMKS